MMIGNIYPSNGQNGEIHTTGDCAPAILSGQGVKGRGIGSCNAPKIIICSSRGRGGHPERKIPGTTSLRSGAKNTPIR